MPVFLKKIATSLELPVCCIRVACWASLGMAGFAEAPECDERHLLFILLFLTTVGYMTVRILSEMTVFFSVGPKT